MTRYPPYRLVHDTARRMAAAACMNAPDGFVVRISEPKKSREQEEKYHALFGDVAKQCTHLNRAFDAEGWKRLLIDQFQRDMLNDPTCDADVRKDLENAVQMVPSLDGCSIVSIGLQSRRFKKKTASAFIEWLNAYAAEHGVVFHDELEAA